MAGVSGAYATMGGDFGVVSYNPAGLAEYMQGEFTFTPAVYLTNSDASLAGAAQDLSRTKTRFGIANASVVFVGRPIASNWVNRNFAIGFNRVADFTQNFQYSGKTTGSITERWAELSNGLSPNDLDDFEAGPAYESGAVFDFEEDLNYETDFEDPAQTVQKEQEVTSTGSINELTLAVGGNYNHKISAGLTFGIPFVNFREEKNYQESDGSDEIPFFDELEYVETLNTSGVGVNVKAGLIFKPVQQFRIGLAVHTPSWYYLTDDFSTEVIYGFTDSNGSQKFSTLSPDGTFDWRISSPWRFIGGIGTIIQGETYRGLIDADIEYVNYQQNSFNLTANSTDPFDREFEQDLNNQIEDKLGASLNFKLGASLVFYHWRFRGGISLIESPYVSDDGFNTTYSGGIGFRKDNFFMDFSYHQSHVSENSYTPYLILNESRQQQVNTSFKPSNFKLTFGFKI
jgi:hypothetical protein